MGKQLVNFITSTIKTGRNDIAEILASSTTKTGRNDIAESGAKTPKIKSKSNLFLQIC
jgi:hypothetical protein